MVLCDASLRDGHWTKLLDRGYRLYRPPLFVAFSRSVDHRLWAEALSLGAYDVLEYPFVRELFLRVLGRACDAWITGRTCGYVSNRSTIAQATANEDSLMARRPVQVERRSAEDVDNRGATFGRSASA